MYAVGSFSSIKQGSRTYARTDIFSFSASSPYTVTSWAPRVVGSTKTDEDGAAAINSIAFSGRKCADAYIGGNFTRVNGTKVSNVAEISLRTGNVLAGFAHSANKTVEHPGQGRGPPADGRQVHVHQRLPHRPHDQPELA